MSMESFSDMFSDMARQFFDEEQKIWCQFEEALRGEHVIQDDFHLCPVCKLRHHPEPVDWEPRVIGFGRADGTIVEPLMTVHPRCDIKRQYFYWKYGFLPGDVVDVVEKKKRKRNPRKPREERTPVRKGARP